MEKILFMCANNSARSQIAEAYLKQFGKGEFQVESAGFKPTVINPLVVKVMREEGVDLSNKVTQSSFDLFKKGRTFTYIITVCDESMDDMCPVFPGMSRRLHIPFDDPAKLEGTEKEKIEKTRAIRDKIKATVKEIINWIHTGDIEKISDFRKTKYIKDG
ncbi:arsenate reductase ArsC [Maridesulfovibrio sp.]|uniref:arsenate reductase ArsC n=1 Tax=Maridesulfovibrio sp. TaxID=2795000 RepID=UPI0029C9FD1D|nr:arsenate reductase ArsC [Maridesulfovibrio sp.]